MNMQNDLNITVVNLPYGLHAFTRQNEDDSYSIVLNARDAWERRADAYLHELEHIARRDFERVDVQEIEFLAHL